MKAILSAAMVIWACTAKAQINSEEDGALIRPSLTPTTLRQISQSSLRLMIWLVVDGYEMPKTLDEIWSWSDYFMSVKGEYQSDDIAIYVEKLGDPYYEFAMCCENEDQEQDNVVIIKKPFGQNLIMTFGVDKGNVKGFLRAKKKQ